MPLRVGLIGTGYWAKAVHAPGVRHHPDADLVGVWGRDPSKAADLAVEFGAQPYSDVDALIGDVDALTFAVPPYIQSDIALRAAEAGRHLLLEKPIATSVAAAERLEEAVAAKDAASLDSLRKGLVEEKSRLERNIGESIDAREDYRGAADLVRKLMFLDRLDAEVDLAYEALE